MIEKDFFVEIGKVKLFTKSYIHTNISIDSPTLIFLHEGLGSVAQWKGFPKKIAEQSKLNTVLYDRSSYSKSTFTNIDRDYFYLHRYTEELNLFINKMSIKKYILVGHSDGGTISLIHSAKNNEGHIASIIISGNTTNESKIYKSITKVTEEFEKENSKLSVGLRKLHKDNSEKVFYAWSNIWRNDIFKNWNIKKEIQKIDIPILAFHGGNDNYTSLTQINNITSKSHIEKVVLKNVGHFPHIEEEELVISKTINFINGIIL